MKIAKYILAVLAVALLLSGCQITGKAASDFGTLEVTSEAGARVYVNGAYRGEVPVSTLLVPGTYSIKVSKPNYYDYESQVVIKIKEVSKVEAKLTPIGEISQKTYGKFTVESDPVGATVLIDSKEVGVTPYATEKLEIGDHLLKVVKAGFADHSTNINIVAGPNSISVKLSALKITSINAGVLKIESDPTASFVFVNNMYKDKTPRELELTAGTYLIRISRGGFRDHVESATVKSGETTLVSAKLAKTGLSS